MSLRLIQINFHHSKAASAALLLRLTEGGADLVLVQDPWVVGGKVAGLGTKEYKLMLDPKEGKIRTCILAKRHLSIFPSHVGIAGNEFADEAAKASTISPLIASANINKLDRNRYLKSTLLNYVPHLINKTSTWYQTTNVSHLNIAHYTKNPVFSKLSRIEQTKLIRLRLGHTRLTHANRFVQPPSNQCKFCNSTDTSITHILNECPSFHNIRPKTPNSDLIPFLTSPKPEKILILLTFLKTANIMNEL